MRFTTQHQRVRSSWLIVKESESGDHKEVAEDAFDLVGSDALGTIKLCWREPSKWYSLRMPPWPRFEVVLILDRPWAIDIRLSEYRAPIATAGLFARNVLHSLSLYANFLRQVLDKQKRVQRAHAHTPRLSLLLMVVSAVGRRDILKSFCALPRIALRTLSAASNELQYTGTK